MFVATCLAAIAAAASLCASQEMTKDSGISPEDREEWRMVRMSPRMGVREKHGIKHFTIGDSSHPTSNYLFFGDSYTGHLTYGLARVALWRDVSFHLSYRPACGLRPPEKSNKNCGKTYDEFWRMVDALPGKKNIVVGNRMEFETKEALEEYIATLYDMVRQKGHTLTVIGNPPFPFRAKSVEEYYLCADGAMSKVGKLVSGVMGKKFRGATHCLNDLVDGFMIQENFWQDDVLAKMSKKIGPSLRFLDWKTKRCRKAVNDEGKPWFRCEYPTTRDGVMYDIGLKPDGRHFTIAGSFNIARVLDEFLFPGQPRTYQR